MASPPTSTRSPSTSTSMVWAPMETKYFTAPPLLPTRKSERGTRNSRGRSLGDGPPPCCSAFPLPRAAFVSRRLQHRHGLHVRRLGEEIERPHGREPVVDPQ